MSYSNSEENTKDENNRKRHNTTTTYHSLPNVRADDAKREEDRKKLYSMSLSQIRKHSTEFSDYNYKPSPFSLRWIYGWNPKAGVINLNRKGSTTVFYAACNCGILYNWTTNQMRILQGHRHMVNSIAADSDGKWLVTSDSGPENLITIWDSEDYFPSKTYFLPHGNNMRVAKVALSADAKFMLTIGYDDKTAIFWWIWSSGRNEPHAALNVDIPKDGVLAMEFNPDNTWQFVLMTKADIWIGNSQKIFVMERGVLKETADYELKVRKIEKKPEIQAFGKLTCFTFVSNTAQILVGTHRGAVHVNGYTIEYKDNIEPKSPEHLKFIKALKLEESRINDIKSIDGVIVTGNNAGQIRFYDEQMKLLHWLQEFTVDRVRSLSFNLSPRSYKIYNKCKRVKKCLCWEKVVTEIDPLTGVIRQKLIKQDLPKEASISGKTFLIRDFIVCTGNQGIGFVDFVTEKLVTILDYKTSSALSHTVHPEKPLVCRGFVDGVIDLVNFTQHKLLARLDLRQHYKVVEPPDEDSIKDDYVVHRPELSVTSLKYSPSGLHLACGLNTGQLLFLDPVTISILTETPFKDTQHAIKDIAYSCDSLTLAFSDAGYTVCVYKYSCDTLAWSFVGKHRAHYKEINALFFTEQQNPDGEYQLLSLGADRIMVEYNIGASSGEHLEIFSLDRLEQTAVPLTGLVWPTPKDLDPEHFHTKLPLIIVATDEHKYKIVNYSTAMTLATVLGPRYESPVFKMQLVSRKEEQKDEQKELEYILFATKNIIGLQKLPLDGNPWKHVGVLGHPLQITDMCFRQDLGVLFTQGSKDICMCQWAANYRSVETISQQSGDDLDPYYCLIENGRPGWLFGEIRDLFYYIQILCQGTFSPTRRTVKDYIPIDSLPDLMRALGFFPSEYEVENLLTEAKFKVYQKTPSAEVDFEEFVKLYLNHRPAFGDDLVRVRNAFRTFATHDRESYVTSREDFVEMLGSYGECFSRELSWYLLSILSGQSFEDRACMPDGDFSFLPEVISLRELLVQIMGIQEVDITADQYSVIESTGSSYGSSVTSEEKERNQ